MKKALLAIPAAIGAGLAATAVKAANFKAESKVHAEMPPESMNIERAAEHLSQAIQIKTVSSDDAGKVDWNEFEKFHAFLAEAFPLITKTLSRENVSTASLLYKWQGTDESLKPIAFLSHMDVVPISEGTEQDWEYPPFEGHNDGTFIWGRGALDMKNHLICLMESVETLLEEGFVPARSVYLCFGHNEEIVASSNSGANDIMETLRARGVELDSIIDEGGAMVPAKVKGLLDGKLAGIGVAEKGYADFKLSVKAKGGHSSQPPKHTAIGEISKAVVRLEKNQFKGEIPDYLNKMFMEVGRHCTYPGRFVMCNYKVLEPLVKFAIRPPHQWCTPQWALR